MYIEQPPHAFSPIVATTCLVLILELILFSAGRRPVKAKYWVAE
jgi:hypothetical protein